MTEIDAWNHSTFIQVFIRSATDMGIAFDDQMSIVTGNASYGKKYYQEVLSAAFPKSAQVLS